MRKITVLVVDDDPFINELLRSCFEAEGWAALSAYDGYTALELIRKNNPDLVILDVMMPGMSGVEVCRRIASVSSAAVVMLSAAGDLDNKLECLKLGADDYITKPFETEELIARAKAVLRRQKASGFTSDVFFTDEILIDFRAKQVTIRGRDVKLTPTEYRLLEELTRNEGEALTYRYLLKNYGEPSIIAKSNIFTYTSDA